MATTSISTSRLLLVADTAPAVRQTTGQTRIRRLRAARQRPAPPPGDPLAALKRAYD